MRPALLWLLAPACAFAGPAEIKAPARAEAPSASRAAVARIQTLAQVGLADAAAVYAELAPLSAPARAEAISLLDAEPASPIPESQRDVVSRALAELENNWGPSAIEGVGENALVPAGALTLAPSTDGPGTLAQRALTLLPSRLRSALAARGGVFAAPQEELLRRELAELLPTEALAFMAFMPQTSQDYLMAALPEMTEELDKTPGADWSVRHEAQKKAWAKRFNRAAVKLAELERLQSRRPTEKTARDLALTHLSLGLFHAFIYGFPDKVAEGGDRSVWIRSSKKSLYPHVDEATRHLEETLRLFESDAARFAKEILFTKFLLGKHAVNGAFVHSNSGSYSFAGEPLAPEPAHARYVALARRLLDEVARQTQPRARSDAPWGAAHELYFEARYQRLRLERTSRPRRGLERLLVDYFLAAPPEVVLGRADRYSLAERLVCDVRLSAYLGGGNNDLLWRLQMDLGNPKSGLTYPKLLRTLVDAGYSELAVLLASRAVTTP